LEYVIEALAPTTERDFTLLPKEKKEVYHRIQMSHMHSSPDGPWFFLIAQSLHDYRLIGITDTSMLRPQVFALQQGAVSIGLSGSEKQAIDAVLKSLAKDDARFWTEADLYWSARGGSFTDGGAFIFTIHPEKDGTATLKCTDKFGHLIQTPSTSLPSFSISKRSCQIPDLPAKDLYAWGIQHQLNQTYEVAAEFLGAVAQLEPEKALEIFTLLLDGHYPIGKMRRSFLRALIERQINAHLKQQPPKMGQTAIIDAAHLPSEGDDSLARIIVGMYREGMTHFIIFNCSGERFIGNGLGPETKGVRIDVYGSSGDYLASGLDGAEMYVHGSAQDQLGQIMHAGLLVIHGSVGQTFMYGAKGGKAFIRGNTAGRPLINAVGNPRVVINGTALDYLAESFMAGNPLKEGGFVVVNGVTFDAQGEMTEMEIPYPGSNLFSLASGGAIYIRDPRGLISTEQLNGGEFTDMTQEDWDLICPLLEENHAHFNIPLERLLSHQSKTLDFRQIYRKIRPAHTRVLQEEEAWVKRKD
jgi:glutamate synthase domain-containing protein 3